MPSFQIFFNFLPWPSSRCCNSRSHYGLREVRMVSLWCKAESRLHINWFYVGLVLGFGEVQKVWTGRESQGILVFLPSLPRLSGVEMVGMWLHYLRQRQRPDWLIQSVKLGRKSKVLAGSEEKGPLHLAVSPFSIYGCYNECWAGLGRWCYCKKFVG